MCFHCKFGAMTCFTCNRHDFNDSIINFWNLKGKELFNERWVRS